MDDSFRVYHSLDAVVRRPRGIALGVFDGFHLGHQSLLGALRGVCRERGLRVGVFTFSFPEGVSFGGRDIHHTELMNDKERIHALKEFGADDVFMIPVSNRIVRLSPAEFLDSVIVKALQGSVLAIGEDARFGYGGTGDAVMLRDFASKSALSALVVPDVVWRGDKVSSTRIRALLASGEAEEASSMMTRPFRLFGRISSVRLGHGAKESRGPRADLRASDKAERDVVLTWRYPERSIVLNRGRYRTRIVFCAGAGGDRMPSADTSSAGDALAPPSGKKAPAAEYPFFSSRFDGGGVSVDAVSEVKFSADFFSGHPSLTIAACLSPDALGSFHSAEDSPNDADLSAEKLASLFEGREAALEILSRV